MKNYTYTVNFEPAKEGGYTVYVPALPGCVTQGETYNEAVTMAREAILCYLESLIKDGEPIPEESKPFEQVALGVMVEVPAFA